jgi:hypothetical protein
MTKAEEYIREAWRLVNEARSKRGARQFDIHDKELFVLGLNAAVVAIHMSPGGVQDLMDAAANIEGRR